MFMLSTHGARMTKRAPLVPALLFGLVMLLSAKCSSIGLMDDYYSCEPEELGNCPIGFQCRYSTTQGGYRCLAEAAYCGDDRCDPDEDKNNCSTDCYCGNGTCESTEHINWCPEDCFCANGTCDQGETFNICPADCPLTGCGDGICWEDENAATCPEDCGLCGNGVCDAGETMTGCFEDCYCGNGSCDPGESLESCYEDCGSVFNCGNGICGIFETPANCPEDCGTCGNGQCDHDETYQTCPADCPYVPYCGDHTCSGDETPVSCPEDCGTCGNGLLETEEVCDGTLLRGVTCWSIGYTQGDVTCNGSCTFDTSQCSSLCGNGIAEPTEDCDATDLAGSSCVTLGFAGGLLQCSGACAHDAQNCLTSLYCYDPLDPAPTCGPSMHCLPTTTSGAPGQCSGPAGAGTQDSPCASDSDCAPSFHCVDPGEGGSRCSQWCMSWTQCPSAMHDCFLLSPSTFVLTQEWGVCLEL